MIIKYIGYYFFERLIIRGFIFLPDIIRCNRKTSGNYSNWTGIVVIFFPHNFCFSILQSARISSKVRLIIQYTTNKIYFIEKLVFHQKSSNEDLQNFELYRYGMVPVLII